MERPRFNTYGRPARPYVRNAPFVWVPEGSLAGFFRRHEMVLDLASGADFPWKFDCKASPGDLEGSRGQLWPKNPRKTDPKISSQTAFRYEEVT